ncbi:NADPH:quinone oxidoreductase family protein [Novosphingobium sp.]|uniref:NADPH:quinone oxidoreductase family protein n=1 Tax=Novosphingobium sp. TaxID=1874826 RepID=UPI002FDA9CAE
MKALLSVAAGGPDNLVIGDAPEPIAGAGQVVIKVRACGVNYPDALIISDQYQYKPQRPFSPGAEVAGEVVEVGSGVADLVIGDRVIAMLKWGGMAELAVAEATHCIRMAENMPFEEGAAFIMGYGTSYYALKQRAMVKPGNTMLILGASGGVGLAAVELGKAMGARVIAAASSDEKVQIALEHGADQGVVYPRNEIDPKALAATLKAACGPGGADIVYDAVGGPYSEAALRCMAWNGRFLVVGFPAGVARIPLNLPLLKGCSVVGVFYGSFAEREVEESRRNNEELMALYRQGLIRPQIHARLPLDKAGDAIEALMSRSVSGKIVVVVSEPQLQ